LWHSALGCAGFAISQVLLKKQKTRRFFVSAGFNLSMIALSLAGLRRHVCCVMMVMAVMDAKQSHCAFNVISPRRFVNVFCFRPILIGFPWWAHVNSPNSADSRRN